MFVIVAIQVWAEIIFAVQNNVEIAFGMDDFGLFLAAQKNIFLAYFALRENPKLVEQAGGYTHTDIKDIFDKLIRPDLEHNIFAGQFLALADAVFSPRGSAEEEKLLSCVNNLKDALKEPAVCEEHQQSRERSYYTNAVQANYYLWLKRSAELAEAKTDDDKKAIQADMDRFKAELRELTTSELGTTKRPLGPRFMFEEILVEKILK